MNRSLQLLLLAWLASLAALGAFARPTLDTLLFAVAFVLGTVLLFARERLKGAHTSKGRAIVGQGIGVLVAWAAWIVRTATPLGARVPPRLSGFVLAIAASVVSLVFVVSRFTPRAAREDRVPSED